MQLSKSNAPKNDPINSIQRSVYERIQKIQSHQKDLLIQRQQVIRKQKKRIQNIQQNSHKEIITHPYNKGHWVSLAGFINEPDDRTLDDIEKRREERRKIRQEMQAKNQERNIPSINYSENNEEAHEQPKSKTDKIQWKLMRELRRKQVQQNKARLQRIQHNQRQKMNKYHKY